MEFSETYSVSVKFKEITLAYEVLSDEEKKKIYDRFGEEHLKQGGGLHNPEDLFSTLFNMGPRTRKGKSRLFTCHLNLLQLFNMILCNRRRLGISHECELGRFV